MYLFISLVVSVKIYLSLQTTDKKCTSTPCSIDQNELNFFIVGDWGGDPASPYTTNIQRNLAKGLNKIGLEKNVSFYISTGDHFYTKGVKNVDDTRFKTTFEDAFNKPAHQKLWHLIAGNHDYYSNISAQLAYTKKSWRWNFPKLYYTVSYQTYSRPMADFILMDTIVLCGNTLGTRDEIPRGPEDVQAANLQWTWIEEKLNSSKTPYLFLVGHYPPRSKGRHGPTTPCFVERIEHLMQKYNVTAFLAGHDHNMQHYRFTSNTSTFEYIVSGLGAMYNDYQSSGHASGGKSMLFYPNKYAEKQSILKETEKGGFVLASLDRNSGKFTFYNGDAVELYSFSVKPRKRI